jgi:hypothetical protein
LAVFARRLLEGRPFDMAGDERPRRPKKNGVPFQRSRISEEALMKTRLAGLIAVAGMLLTVKSVSAHHSISGEYFTNQRSTVEGDVVQFHYINPHSLLEVKSKDPNSGEALTWKMEWNSPARLSRDHVTAETLKPGDHVIITGQPGRNHEDHRLHVLTISRPADRWEWRRGGRY